VAFVALLPALLMCSSQIFLQRIGLKAEPAALDLEVCQ